MKMTNFKKQIVSAMTAGALVLNVATPAFAGTTIEISGNGAGSDNWTVVNQTTTNTVTQNNSANVTNNVDADADTGDNDANLNTGGDVSIKTGNATAGVSVVNTLNSNTASVDCCAAGNTNVTVSGNGAKSDNGVTLGQTTVTTVTQNNGANVTNNVDVDADSGNNDANSNTGGDVTIKTGSATAGASVATTANVNSAVVGGGLGSGNPSASFIISGNGAGSDNYITAGLTNITTLNQGNSANVTNNVDADADTGDNDANLNTGGDVIIETGNAAAGAEIDNSVNFNHADVDCGCTWNVLAKISGNGADAHDNWLENIIPGLGDENLITLGLTSVQNVGQGNGSNLTNNAKYLDADSGNNEVSSNTAEGYSDPSVKTGNAEAGVEISNSGNVNVVGDMSFDWPEMPEVDFSFNVAALLAFFGMSF